MGEAVGDDVEGGEGWGIPEGARLTFANTPSVPRSSRGNRDARYDGDRNENVEDELDVDEASEEEEVVVGDAVETRS